MLDEKQIIVLADNQDITRAGLQYVLSQLTESEQRQVSDKAGMMAVLSIYSAIAASLQDSGFVAALTNKPRPTHRDYNSVFWFNISCSAFIYIVLWFCAPLIIVGVCI